MASSQDRGSGEGRRDSVRIPRLSLRIDDADDGYDLSDLTVADGFRPQQQNASTSDSSSASPPPRIVRRPVPMPPPPVDRSTKPLQSSKSGPQDDSLALRNDGSNNGARFGSSGPSHPYEMYSQRTTGEASGPPLRTANDGLSGSSSGPTHPYSAYPQNTTPEDFASDPYIPVVYDDMGGVSYRRHMGFENASSSGSVDHGEDLPPYSRYPEGHVRQSESTETTSTPTSGREGQPSSYLSVSGTNGMGSTTRNTEQSPTESVSANQQSVTRFSEPANTEINTTSSPVGEKKSGWRERSQKKVCGFIPCWAVFSLIVIIIVAILMAAILGEELKHNGGDDNWDGGGGLKYHPAPTPTDIVVITDFPNDLTPLPTGIFTLPEMLNFESSTACIYEDGTPRPWSCDIIQQSFYLEVQNDPTAPALESYNFHIIPMNATASKFKWGTQPPSLQSFWPLMLVEDVYETGLGPAWWCQTHYDKKVILPEASINYTSELKNGGNSRRSERMVPNISHMLQRSDIEAIGAKDGDKPWVCTWPKTSFEAFFFPDDNGAAATTTAAEETTSGEETSTATEESTETSTEAPYSTTMMPSTQTVMATTTEEHHPSHGPPWQWTSGSNPYYTHPTGPPTEMGYLGKRGQEATTSGVSTEQATSTVTGTATATSSGAPTTYGKTIKFLEQRQYDPDDVSTHAYCMQVEITDGGTSSKPVKDSSGDNIQFYIHEDLSGRLKRDLGSPVGPRGLDKSDCGCLWWAQ